MSRTELVSHYRLGMEQALMQLILSTTIVSLFFAGGLFAYVRELVRLQGLMSNGKTARATIINTEIDDSGSESIVHYLVTYEFINESGQTLVHEQDLNSWKLFSTLEKGSAIDVLYDADSTGNSYPLSRIQADRNLNFLIAVAIVVFWAGMVLYFSLR